MNLWDVNFAKIVENKENLESKIDFIVLHPPRPARLLFACASESF